MLNKSALIVLGMHRSGTSLLCKGIASLGVDFGDRLLQGDQWNEKGYFEHYGIQQLNDRMLQLLGVRWYTLDISRWEDALPWTYSLRSQAVEILRRDFGDVPIWGVKDPRMCRLLPFWKGVFNEVGVSPKYVLTLRNPLNIALSLNKRDGISVVDGALLWLSHMATAFIDSEKSECFIIEYENLMADPLGELDRLREAFNLPFYEGGAATREHFASKFLDRGLYHNQESIDALWANADIPDEVKSLYVDMRKMASSKPTDADWQRLRDKCRELMSNWWPRHVVSFSSPMCDERVVRESVAMIARLRSELLNTNAEFMAAEAKVASLAALIGEKDAEIMRLRKESYGYREAIGEKDDELVRLRSELERFRAGKQLEIESLAQENADLREDLANKLLQLRRYGLLMKMSGVSPDP